MAVSSANVKRKAEIRNPKLDEELDFFEEKEKENNEDERLSTESYENIEPQNGKQDGYASGRVDGAQRRGRRGHRNR